MNDIMNDELFPKKGHGKKEGKAAMWVHLYIIANNKSFK